MNTTKYLKGDHLRINRGKYDHHGIYVGRGLVVHYDGGPKAPGPGEVRRVRVKTFAKGGRIEVVDYPSDECLTPAKVVRSAESRIGERKYSIFSNNCEMLAIECKTGIVCRGHQIGGTAEQIGADAVRGGAAGIAIGSTGVFAGVVRGGFMGGLPGAIAGGFIGGLASYLFRGRSRGRPEVERPDVRPAQAGFDFRRKAGSETVCPQCHQMCDDEMYCWTCQVSL